MLAHYLLVYAFLVVLSLYVTRTWLRWRRINAKPVGPRWKSRLAVSGFLLSTTSLVLIVALGVHAFTTGGFAYNDPMLLLAFRIGYLTALLGMVAALVGAGQLEVPTIVCSVLCLLIWFGESMVL